MSNNATTTAIEKKEKPHYLESAQALVSNVESKITEHMRGGSLDLPPNYSVGNALRSAWLILQDVQDKDKKPALEVCSKVSIVNALMNMAVQGLDPAKKQCYFIVYGKALTLQRSYFGEVALLKRAKPGWNVDAAVVFEGDDIDYRRVNGRIVEITHKENLANNDPTKIKAAYCVVRDENDNVVKCEVMTWERIQRSWKMSKTAHFAESTHKKFPEEMSMRTIIRYTCKAFINTSSDEMLIDSVNRSDSDAVDAEMAEAVELYGNDEELSLPAPEDVEETESEGSQPTLAVEGESEDTERGDAPY